MELDDFNPNGVGLSNGHFIGLPFTEEEARIVCISVPWDVTVSYAAGTSLAPQNILQASLQLDLYQPDIVDAWKLGIYVRNADEKTLHLNDDLRLKSQRYIHFIEEGGAVHEAPEMANILNEINGQCALLNQWVYEQAKELINSGKFPVVVGGEHSVPLGLLHALSEKHSGFGVLHIDAHMDLRHRYEGFTYSHASIYNNAITKGYVKHLVQVGIRDYCDEEQAFAKTNNVQVFYDDELKTNAYRGISWHDQCHIIIENLPNDVYISFDIDGLNPHLCPGTGTPVPSGLEFAEACYLIKELVKRGKKIIGFDLCEVGGENEWDGNVGARILYFLSNWMGRSQGLI